MSRKAIVVLLLLCMLITLFPCTAALADTRQISETVMADVSVATAENTVDESAVKSIFDTDFYVKANEEAGTMGNVEVDMDLVSSNGKLYLPGGADASKLFLSWDSSDVTVTVNGMDYAAGKAPVPAVGESLTYKVTKGLVSRYITVKSFQGSDGVRSVFLDIDESMGTIDAMNDDSDHKTECYGTFIIDGEEYYMSIKGRGNSTWVFEKKPYNITFYKKSDFADKKKVELIDGVKSKKWSILANYLDSSLLRNKLAFDLACDLGIGLESEFVDIYMNGEYLGNYILCPKKDYNCSDDGFIIENDHIEDTESGEQFVFPNIAEMPLKHNRINVDDIGDNAVEAGWDNSKIEEWFTEAWNTVLDTDSEEYRKYFDLDSWAKMYLMFEVSKTYDCYAGNIIMHRDGTGEDDLLYAGPVWDYDIAFGRTLHKFLVGVEEGVQLNAEGWYNDSVGLIIVSEPYSVLQGLGIHESFMKRVTEIYNEYKGDFKDLSIDVATLAELLQDSALMNNELWGTNHIGTDYLISSKTIRNMGTGEYKLNYELTTTWDNYVNNLKEYCNKRVMWMSDHMAATAPEGSIVQSLNEKTDAVELMVQLTAGNNGNTYQWQSSKNGKKWADIESATASKLVVEYNTDNAKIQYRCIVSNEGVDIYTRHGGRTKASARTTLEPVTLNATKTTARVALIELKNGKFEMELDGKSMGDFTLTASGTGWTLKNDNGKYLAASGSNPALSSNPYVWSYDNGVFFANVKVSKTAIGKWLGIGPVKTVYLAQDSGTITVSLNEGAKTVFYETVTLFK